MKAEHFSPAVRELIVLLADHRVRYLLVGGEAVIYHGYPRLTGYVDFWFEPTADNADRLGPRRRSAARGPGAPPLTGS